jgi:Mrp family chromosome partitioning ATPase
MVVRAGKLHEDVVRMAQQQVENVGGRVVAAVLNDPDAEVKRYGGDYYFTGYPAERSGKS